MWLEINIWNVNSKHAFTLRRHRDVSVILPYTPAWWGWMWWWISVCMERQCHPSTLKQPLIRVDVTRGGKTMEGFVFSSLTKLDQRLAWKSKKRCLSKYVCWNRAFDLSSLFLHAQGTNSTQNPSQGAYIHTLLVLEGWKRIRFQ